VFSILESGNKTIPLVADGLFDLLMNKMTTIYTSKKQTKIEAKGPRFEIGDFCVKLGSVTMSQNFKGVLVEVSELSIFFRFIRGVVPATSGSADER
jgi:mediator of RNA polymerase II transcription subunit 20